MFKTSNYIRALVVFLFLLLFLLHVTCDMIFSKLYDGMVT